ncbi:PLDc N-terminal domain-containing protein [Sulfidibacter corallicola]|uniref:PLDc N-terminal domain-containing protein n=1 Tax=Sulfidibacter corallicola TaxID=2818388 RepID=A0A8A4TE57_SULCO|nr:PLDc N-terminal domain-containing protein [Sulfidibacter corallicola]QTD48236.1 PLDc N-terminal domain-containing protein [Sulfidibacter corallicola]
MFDDVTLVGLLVTLVHVLGALNAVDAVMKGRSPQGAVAWAISLVLLPYFALPMYWVFGQRRFHGYVHARRAEIKAIYGAAGSLAKVLKPFRIEPNTAAASYGALEHLAKMPFTQGNRSGLLVDGEDSFAAMFAALREAREYVLVQFFSIHADAFGYNGPHNRDQELSFKSVKVGPRVNSGAESQGGA